MITCKKKCGAGKLAVILLWVLGTAALVYAHAKWIKKYLPCKCGQGKSDDCDPDLDFDFDEECDCNVPCDCPAENEKKDEKDIGDAF